MGVTTAEAPMDMKLIKKAANGTEEELTISDYFDTSKWSNDNKTIIKLKDGKTLPALGPGESYELNYKLKYEGIDELNGGYNIQNTINAGNDKDNGWDQTNLSFSHTWISKSGQYDEKTGEIVWTITVNDFGGDIDGYRLDDILKKNGVIVEGSKAATMVEYNGSEKVADYEITLPYTFNRANVSDITNKFVITYKTKTTNEFYSSYTNKAEFSKDGDGTGGGSKFETGEIRQDITKNSGTLTKNYMEPDKDDTETDETTANEHIYRWQVKITAPSDGIKNGSYYLDEMSRDPWKNSDNADGGPHYMTATQLKNLKILVKEKDASASTDAELDTKYYVKQVEINGQWVDFSNQEGPFRKYRILFKGDEATKKLPENVEQLTLVYKTTGNLSNMANGETWTFKNKGTFVQDGGSAGDEDSKKESKGGYLKKLDVGGTNGSYVYDETKGVLYYCLVINELGSLPKTGGGELTITDQLPDGTELYEVPYNISTTSKGKYNPGNPLNDCRVKIYVNQWGLKDKPQAANWLGKGYEGAVDLQSYVSVNYDKTGNKLTVTIPEAVYSFSGNSGNMDERYPLYLFYAVKIKDETLKDMKDGQSFTNHAQLTWQGGTAADETTSTVKKSYISKMRNPEVNDAENEISYRILINPGGETKADGNPFTVTDTVDYSAHTVNGTSYILGVGLKPQSLHLYYRRDDGTKGAELDSSTYSLKCTESSQKFEMVLTVPDGTPMILEYTYVTSIDVDLLNEQKWTEYTFTNNVRMEGGYSDESSVTDQEKIKGSSAVVRVDRIELVKVDAENENIYLKGAKFLLQKYNPTKDQGNWQDETCWEPVKLYTTGANGTVVLGGLTDNVAYRLIEQEAPTNYQLDATPHYFYIKSAQGDSTDALPEGFMQVAMNSATGYITLTNAKGETKNTSVEVRKNWLSSKGSPMDTDKIVDAEGRKVLSIKLKLYQKLDENARIDETETPFEEAELAANDTGEWYHIFNHLPAEDENGNSYYYYVKEGTMTVLDSDNQEKTIEVSAAYESTSDTRDGITGGVITLTNQKKPGNTSVTVEKQWKSGTPQTEVPVTLYRSSIRYEETEAEETKEITYTLEYERRNPNDPSKTEQGTTVTSGTVSIPISGSNVKLTVTGNATLLSAQYTENGQTITLTGHDIGDGKHAFILRKVKSDVTLHLVYSGRESISLDGKHQAALILTDGTNKMLKLPPDAQAVQTVTLGASQNSENTTTGWTWNWTELDDTYYYYVVEGDRGKGYLDEYYASYLYTYGDEAKTSIQKVQITNETTRDENETDISVKKVWLDAEGKLDTNPPESLQVKLWKKDAFGNNSLYSTITLGTANAGKRGYSEDGWSYTWSKISKGNYFIEEEELSSYSVRWSKSGDSEFYTNAAQALISEGTITITNKKEESRISVKKEWLNADGKESLDEKEHPKSIQVQLYKELTENGNKVYREVGKQITLGPEQVSKDGSDNGYSDNGWTYTWPAMEKGNYYVEEVGTPSGYKVFYTVDNGEKKASAAEASVVNGFITVINQKEATSLSASKKWNDNNNTAGLRPDSVNLKLYRTTKQLEEEVGNAVTLRIKWQPNTEPSASYGAVIQIVLYTKENNQEVSAGTAYLSAENGWSYTFTGLYKNVTEYYANAWRTGTVLPNGVNVWGGGSCDSEGFITFEGNSSLHTQSIEAEQEVVAASLIPETASTIRTTSAQTVSSVTLPRADGTLYSVEDAEYVSGMDKTLDASNNWSASWENLDKTDANGNLYYYFVVEDPVPGGYSPSYEITYKGNRPVNEVSSITVTNKLDITKPIQIDVEKKWKDSVTDHRSYTVEVKLYDSSGNKVTVDKSGTAITNPVTLSTENEWKSGWTNLTPGIYYVRETKATAGNKGLTGYTTTYQSGGTELTPNESLSDEAKGAVKTTGNLVTITNTREETGIILPGTGSKYPLVFYGLGIAFLSVSAVWMFLTLKKKNKPYYAGKGGKKTGGTGT